MTGASSDRAGADDQAAEWLLLHERTLAPNEAAEFEKWLSAPVNAEAWAHAQRIWSDFDQSPDPLLASILQSARSLRRPVWRTLPFQGAAMAASILLCLGVLAWDRGAVPGEVSQATLVAAAEPTSYTAGPRRTEILLHDGTRVLLDARSKIEVKESAGRRDVALLDGQAFFKVFHDASRPFVVAADGRTVTATGTAFAVSLLPHRMTVVLEEGSVIVGAASGGATKKLAPGQQFVAASGRDGSVGRVDVEDALAWRAGYAELHNVTIGEAVAQMNRYTDTPVVIGDAKVGGLHITGRFRTDDPVRFVETLAELYPVSVQRTGRVVMIVSNSAGKER